MIAAGHDLRHPVHGVPVDLDASIITEKVELRLNEFNVDSKIGIITIGTPKGSFTINAQQIADEAKYKIPNEMMLARYCAIGLVAALKDPLMSEYLPKDLKIAHERGRATIEGDKLNLAFALENSAALIRLIDKVREILEAESLNKEKSLAATKADTKSESPIAAETKPSEPQAVTETNTTPAAPNLNVSALPTAPEAIFRSIGTGMVFENTGSGTQRAIVIEGQVAMVFFRRKGETEWVHEGNEDAHSLDQSYSSLVASGDYKLLATRVDPATLPEATPFT